MDVPERGSSTTTRSKVTNAVNSGVSSQNKNQNQILTQSREATVKNLKATTSTNPLNHSNSAGAASTAQNLDQLLDEMVQSGLYDMSEARRGVKN